MSDSVEKKKVPAEAGEAKGGGEDVAALVNSLRLEREKNEVLLQEVVALEDERVNRQLGDYAGVIGEQTREFWREQLLANREGAVAEVAALAHEKSVIDAALQAVGSGDNKVWSSGADPVADVDDAILEVIKAAKYGSLMGVGVLFGATAWKVFKNQEKVRNRFVVGGGNGGQRGKLGLAVPTEDSAGQMFIGAPNVRTSYMIYDGAAEGLPEDINFLLDSTVLVFARKEAPTRRDPSFMKTFRLMNKFMVPGSYARDDGRVEVAKSPGPGRARVLKPLSAMQTQGVGVQALSVRAVEVDGDVPAFGLLSVTSPVGGEIPEWRGMDWGTHAVSVEALPARERWDAWAPWTSLRDVRVAELTLSAEGVDLGLRAFEPIRAARVTTAGWDLVPFPVARHSRMGDLRVAANAAEARGDAEEAARLRREFLRIADVMEVRREAFAGRPVPRRGGVGDER